MPARGTMKGCQSGCLHGVYPDSTLGCQGCEAYPKVDVLPGMNAGASTHAVPSPIEGSGTAWVLLGSWALSPARPTPIHPRPDRRGFSALLVMGVDIDTRVYMGKSN